DRSVLEKIFTNSYDILTKTWIQIFFEKSVYDEVLYKGFQTNIAGFNINEIDEKHEQLPIHLADYEKDRDYFRRKIDDIVLISKDAIRTCCCVGDYSNQDLKIHQASVFKVLVSFIYNHPTISYHQGMTDVVSCFLNVMQSEYEAYLCFTRFVEDFGSMYTEIGVLEKCAGLRFIIRTIDKELFYRLQKYQISDMTCCFRMFMTFFLREFTTRKECLRFLEMLCARLYLRTLKNVTTQIPADKELTYDLFTCSYLIRRRTSLEGDDLLSAIFGGNRSITADELLKMSDLELNKFNVKYRNQNVKKRKWSFF
ncbi:hypothetical protein GJ496_002053, partial [Pomphorhynchus laevis]